MGKIAPWWWQQTLQSTAWLELSTLEKPVNSFKQWTKLISHSKKCRKASELSYQFRDTIEDPSFYTKIPVRFSYCFLSHDGCCSFKQCMQTQQYPEEKAFLPASFFFMIRESIHNPPPAGFPLNLTGQNWSNLIKLVRPEERRQAPSQ